MSALSFSVLPPSEGERRQAAYPLQKVIRARRGGDPVYVGRGVPPGAGTRRRPGQAAARGRVSASTVTWPGGSRWASSCVRRRGSRPAGG